MPEARCQGAKKTAAGTPPAGQKKYFFFFYFLKKIYTRRRHAVYNSQRRWNADRRAKNGRRPSPRVANLTFPKYFVIPESPLYLNYEE
jgi:hypothetical protein